MAGTKNNFIGRVSRRGFTLIEILIVVIILGILASIVIPQFSNASQESREATLRDCLHYLRTQITIYKAQHGDVAPGFPNGDPTASPDFATFVSQMTSYTDLRSNTSANFSAVFQFGPYLSQMPANPLNGNNGIIMTTGAIPAPDASQPMGWIYNPVTTEIIANVPGTDEQGVAYTNY